MAHGQHQRGDSDGAAAEDGGRRRAGRDTADAARRLLASGTLPEEARSVVAALVRDSERLEDALTEARRQIAVLERLSHEDSLVPVLNRRGFHRALARAISYIRRHGTMAALVFIDLDGLKRVNDGYGHAVGDAALNHCGLILRGNLRASDSIGRIGGDEFGVILWNAAPADAAVKARSLTRLIAAQPLAHRDGHIAVSVSAGVTVIEGGDTPETALSRADQAMYADKRRRAGMDGKG